MSSGWKVVRTRLVGSEFVKDTIAEVCDSDLDTDRGYNRMRKFFHHYGQDFGMKWNADSSIVGGYYSVPDGTTYTLE